MRYAACNCWDSVQKSFGRISMNFKLNWIIITRFTALSGQSQAIDYHCYEQREHQSYPLNLYTGITPTPNILKSIDSKINTIDMNMGLVLGQQRN